MGCFLCEKHGEADIIQLSKTLIESYRNNKQTKITLLVFQVPEIPELYYYFDASEDLSSFLTFDSFQAFESRLSEISGNPVACVHCFQEYQDNLNITISKLTVTIPVEH